LTEKPPLFIPVFINRGVQQMSKPITKFFILLPAYGRTYASEEAARADWDANKDFRIKNGPYVNKAQSAELLADGYAHVELGYKTESGYISFFVDL
jgi:hypothetical protein